MSQNCVKWNHLIGRKLNHEESNLLTQKYYHEFELNRKTQQMMTF